MNDDYPDVEHFEKYLCGVVQLHVPKGTNAKSSVLIGWIDNKKKRHFEAALYGTKEEIVEHGLEMGQQVIAAWLEKNWWL